MYRLIALLKKQQLYFCASSALALAQVSVQMIGSVLRFLVVGPRLARGQFGGSAFSDSDNRCLIRLA